MVRPIMCTLRSSLVLVALVLSACGGPSKETSVPTAGSAEPVPAVADVATTESKEAAPAEEPEPTTPECSKDSECTIFADCCTCKAIPTSIPQPDPCDSVCGEAPCQVKGKTIQDVYCSKEGRCKLK